MRALLYTMGAFKEMIGKIKYIYIKICTYTNTKQTQTIHKHTQTQNMYIYIRSNSCGSIGALLCSMGAFKEIIHIYKH